MNLNRNTLAILGAAALLAVPLVAAALDDGAPAANKTAATGSTVEFLSTGAATATVLATTIKTSAPQDLIFSVTSECALWTTVATTGSDESTARSTVSIQVLFDGAPVPVSGASDDGRVVFCDRTHRQTVTNLDDDDARIEQYLATRDANGFNWILPDVGSGVHTVQVQATLSASSTDALFVQAGVGHRTLIVEPTHLAQGFTL
jgi:hypothetical protein